MICSAESRLYIQDNRKSAIPHNIDYSAQQLWYTIYVIGLSIPPILLCYDVTLIVLGSAVTDHCGEFVW